MPFFARQLDQKIEFPRMGLRLASPTALVCLAVALPLAFGAPRLRRHKTPPPIAEILKGMNESAKHLKTVSANLEYTKVTVVVNDKSTEYGQLFFKKGKSTEIKIDFQKPDPKVILFRKNKAEIYLPKSNQIQVYDLQKQSGLVEKFLLLGFGEEVSDLKKEYDIKLTGEEDLNGDTTAVLELTPRAASISDQLTKVQLWVSEDSWMPAQQKFFEPGGDYLQTHYTNVKINLPLLPTAFQIKAPDNATRVKVN